MRIEPFTYASALGALFVLAACTPDEPSSGGGKPGAWTPTEVEKELDAFGQDLDRILAVVEPLGEDWEAASRHVLEDDALVKLVDGHLKQIEEVSATLRAMKPEERASYADSIQSSLQSMELRMTEIYASSSAAADAFAPMFTAAEEALRSCL
ncbi:MAG: hypothetical protein DVB23_000219 [Verrucomicrobia bacterium]|jgi:hypothetical protein|nr:MAG: hypothetical protein DVB23_000219 [Verrucomicrobiota bacterium]